MQMIGRVAGWLVCLCVALAVQAQDVVFDNRDNVNVLNASNPTLTAGQGGSTVAKLRFACSDTFWEGFSNPPGSTNWIAIDFQTTRNIKHVRIHHYNTSAATAGAIATSSDGTTWTSQANTWTMTGSQADIVLSSAVDARYLKIVAVDIQDGNGSNRWLIYALRVFGDTGTLTDPDGVVDLISSTGWSGGVTMTLNGISITDTTSAQFVNDALNPLKRQVLYSVSTGDTITYQFDRDFLLHGLGMAPLANNASSSFDLHVSTNGTDYVLAASHTGVTAFGTYLTFTPKRARYARITFGTWDGSANGYINDIQLFGLTPTTNRAPVTSSQSTLTTMGVPRSITLAASDPDGDSIAWQVATNPAHGTLSGTLPNVTYTPTYGYVGSDAFFFTVSDGLLASAPTRVSIEVYPAGTVGFEARDRVNLVNASNVVLTAGQGGSDVGKLRMAASEQAWDGLANPPGGTNWVAVDFQTARNIKTVRLLHWNTYEATAGTVSTSDDGTTWTHRPASWTLSAASAQIELASAVTARHLRIIATEFSQSNDRWLLYCLRVFGTAGLLTDSDGVLDLVSGTGFSGGVTLTLNGTVSITDTSVPEFIEDALYPLKRQVIHGMGAGEGFTLQFDRDLTMRTLGLFPIQFDASASFTVETSTNGVNYANVLTRSGGILAAPQYFSLTPSTGRYLRFTLTSTSSTDNRLGDIQVFGHTPLMPPPALPPGTVIMVR